MVSRQIRRAQERAMKPSSQQQKIAQRRKAVERKKAEKKQEKLSIWQRVAQFLKEVKVEMKKVIWPTRSEVLNYTIVVLITVAIVTTFILVLDLALSRILQLVI